MPIARRRHGGDRTRRGGINTARPAWLRAPAAWTRAHGALLVVHDSQLGCGRTGPFFSFEISGIVPDVVCLSQSISGYGAPMALTLMRPEYDVWAAPRTQRHLPRVQPSSSRPHAPWRCSGRTARSKPEPHRWANEYAVPSPGRPTVTGFPPRAAGVLPGAFPSTARARPARSATPPTGRGCRWRRWAPGTKW
ncbi:aminotransferase class III-fold pyridoxal phosphate-dependent enzyme [Streptomyces sp. SID9727]|nr:aminotransferase class III-fold pyridoxal phosphate-dependent enzyme [Streptomyces sp. SID9727]